MVIILGVPIFRIFTVELALIEKMKMAVSSGEFVALLFYVHGKHLRSCWDGQ